MPERGDEVDPAAEAVESEAVPEDVEVEVEEIDIVEVIEDAEPAEPLVADPELLAAVPLALQALREITPENTIGEPLGHVVEAPGVVSLLFASRLSGYPDWHWTVTVGRASDDDEPTVLEAELMPGDGSLLAPDWVPWSERLAEYQAAQEANAGAEAESEDDDDDVDGVHDLHDDEETDVDTDLDLEAEEAAALADEDADDEDSDDDDDDDVEPDEDSDEDDDEPDASAAALDGEVAESEDAEDESDDDGPEPGAGGDDRSADDQHDDEGDHPQG